MGLTADLSCEAAAQVDGAGLRLGCLEPQHDSRGEFIVSIATTGLLLFISQTHTKKTVSNLRAANYVDKDIVVGPKGLLVLINKIKNEKLCVGRCEWMLSVRQWSQQLSLVPAPMVFCENPPEQQKKQSTNFSMMSSSPALPPHGWSPSTL